MNDPTRIQWNEDGREAARRCNGNLKLYERKFMEVREERAARKGRAIERYERENGPARAGCWRIYADGNDEIVTMEFDGGKAITQLANIVTGLPRLSDHSIDTALALQVVNANFSDLAMRAAGDYLNSEAQRLLRNENIGTTEAASDNPYQALWEKMFRVAVSNHPAVASAYNGSALTAEGLVEILWPLFKVARQAADRNYAQRNNFDQRNYESIRTYTFNK